MTDLDISQWKWTETLNGNTSNELLTLKKNLANDVVDKLFEKDSNFVSALFKGSVVDYLVDENTINDALHDEVLVWGLWQSLWLVTPELKKYREMFSRAKTRTDLESLKTTIFNEIDSKTSISSQQSSTTTASTVTIPGLSWSVAWWWTAEKAKVDTSSESYEIDHLNFIIPQESKNIYNNLKWKEKPDLEPFACALKVYNSLKSQWKLKNTKYLTVVDFTKKKSKNRMFVINTQARIVEHAVKCGHWKWSWSWEYATSFWNKWWSNKSSLWWYITPDKITKTTRKSWWYWLRQITGIESSNSTAAWRWIAIHPWWVNWSEWCFTIPKSVSSEIMNKQIWWSLLFAYAESKQYFAQSNYFKQDSNGNFIA